MQKGSFLVYELTALHCVTRREDCDAQDLLSAIEQLACQREYSHPQLRQKHVLLREYGKMTGPVNRGESLARGL